MNGRKVVQATRRLSAAYDRWVAGEMPFAEFDASVQGWIEHARHADSLGIREHVLSRFDIAGSPGTYRQPRADPEK